MTTKLCKTSVHKKARTISSGFLRVINTFVLTPRQGIATERRTSFRSIVLHHENDNSTPVGGMASDQAHKSTSVWFVQYSRGIIS